MSSKVAILVVLGLGCLSHAQEGPAVLDGWDDGEIRSRYIETIKATDVSLGLWPAGPHGTLTLVLSARLPQRLPVEPPGTLQVYAAAGLRVNPNVIRSPVLVFMLDPGTRRTMTIDLSERLRFLDLEAIDNTRATMSLVEFIQLLRAETVTGRILGLDISLTLKQRQALRVFGDRILRPSR